MYKKLRFLSLIGILIIIFSTLVFANPNEKANVNGLENSAEPANPGEPGVPATPANPAHKSEDNILYNAYFQEALSDNQPNDQGVVDTEESWIFFTNSGADADFELDKKVAKVTPTNISNSPSYGIQLIQAPVSVEKLGIYKVSIIAKAAETRNITIKVGATGNNGWKAYSQNDINLSTEYKTYEYEFTMYDDTDEAARFEIFLAQHKAPVWIKHVSMERIGEAEPIITEEELLSREKTEDDENLVEDWKLVWSDEFDGDYINTDNWSFDIGNGADKGIPGWGNNELEYYTNSQENAYIENGNLVIQALKEEKNFTVDGTDYTTDYTSARMVTQGKVNTTYGRIEARIKVPSGQGIWPAFWMLGEDIDTVGWPQCGEIDILEYIGSNVTEVHGTVHGPVTAGPGINGHIDIGTDYSQDFHTYAIEWDEDEVEFYVDDTLYHIVNKDEVAFENGPEEWVYDHDHFMILNLAVGGNWPGAPDDTTTFPKKLEVDYIRIYEDVNPATIDGEEVIDTVYELPPVTPGIEGFSNGTFDEGTEGWTSYIHYDAVGTFEVIDGEGVFNLENDGNEDYSAHLYQGPFKFEGSKSYTLEFDARTSIPRDLLVVIDNAGYYRFVNEKVSLNESMNTYSINFSGINEEATIKLLVGELGNDVSGPMTIAIDNVKLFETEGTGNETEVGYLYDFDNNMSLDNNFFIWQSDEWSGPGAGTLNQETGTLTIDVTSVGNAYSPQVYQDGMTFENGETYLVSFAAKSEEPKTINVNVGRALGIDPWWMGYVQTHTYVLDETLKPYSFTFTMTEETYNNGKIVFELGTINGDTTTTTVTIDKVNVVKLNSMIDNTAWNIWQSDEWSGPGAGTLAVVDENLTVDVTAVGNAYSPQVFQDGMTFENGVDYLVMFDASAQEPKTINVNVGKALSSEPWWTAYAPTETYVLGTETKTYAYSFTMTQDTFDNGKIVFEFGTINGDDTTTVVDISNVRIIRGARILN